MHISEGILSGPVLLSGGAIAVVGTAIGLKKLDYDRIPQAGILAASFFVASLVHLPFGAGSVHLVFNGLIGLMLGWGAFPVILVALILQAILFQFGGLTTLGVNTVVMALPAVMCYYAFQRILISNKTKTSYLAFACGFSSVLLSSLLMAFSLIFSGEKFIQISTLIFMTHLPVMIVEGVITAFCISFLRKVQPSLLHHYST